MPIITRALLRKRSEHNEGMISTLEEITLHQEELEGINEVLGATCRKIKILYLQNNLISKLENLTHLKELNYLNLALNNIEKIEGLQNCEFLNKLDLTVNFIDVDELESSINHLAALTSMRDLYMMGNPAEAEWDKFKSYVIAKMPQLITLDGIEITRSMQIAARQSLPSMEIELRTLASKKRKEKEEKAAIKAKEISTLSQEKIAKKKNEIGEDDEIIEVEELNEEEERNKMTDNSPEVRNQIYKEIAQQKKEKADREKENQPRERDYEKEQADSIAALRKKEEESGEREIKQKNEGGWSFRWDEESQKGCVILDVGVARHLDSSLIDVDVHPTYVSIIIKSKCLRLRIPAEVKVSESKCQRSKTTGSLLIIMPKVNAKENDITIRGDIKARNNDTSNRSTESQTVFKTRGSGVITPLNGAKKAEPLNAQKVTRKPKVLSMQEQMLLDANNAIGIRNNDQSLLSTKSNLVDVTKIIRKKNDSTTENFINLSIGSENKGNSLIQEVQSGVVSQPDDDDIIPPVVPVVPVIEKVIPSVKKIPEVIPASNSIEKEIKEVSTKKKIISKPIKKIEEDDVILELNADGSFVV